MYLLSEKVGKTTVDFIQPVEFWRDFFHSFFYKLVISYYNLSLSFYGSLLVRFVTPDFSLYFS